MQEPRRGHDRLVSSLKTLGLTKYEALVYIALLRVGNATATGIHEISGVPRASVYPVLDQLLDKSLVSVSQESPKRFAAVPPEKGMARLQERVQDDADFARTALTSMYREQAAPVDADQGLIWNVHGIGAIRDRMADLIAGANDNVRIIAHPQILSPDIRKLLSGTAERVAVEIVTPRWEGKVPPKMTLYLRKHVELPRELAKAKDMLAGGICITDDRTVMVMVGSGDEDAVALFSGSPAFVRFFIRYYNIIISRARKPE
ncbi:MAG TPA: helix-turn-helix domain-containing protein [Methanoregula sp.]|nr:helix-turn-helix domain-containing protein [Methanoregula sp.]